MNIVKRLPVHFLAASVLLVPFVSGAAVISGQMYEPFDYAVGNLAGNGGGSGFNATGDPSLPNTVWGLNSIGGALLSGGTPTVVSGSLLYDGIVSEGNRALFDGSDNSSDNLGRLLGQTLDSGSFYFSYLTDRNNETLRSLHLAFFEVTTTGTTTTTVERVGIGQLGGGSTVGDGNFRMVANGNQTTGLVSSTNPIAYGTGVTHLVIGRIDFNVAGPNTDLDRLTLYIDPTAGQLANPVEANWTPYIQNEAFNFFAINAVRPFAGNNATGANPYTGVSGDFDQIRLGGTLQSVIIPEPSSALLLGAAAVGVIGRRKRRA